MKKRLLLSLFLALAFILLTGLTSCGSYHTHSLVYHSAAEPDCITDGNLEYWECTKCKGCYSDADAKTTISNITILSTGHNFEDNECTNCGKIVHSPGLEYRRTDDGNSYVIAGIGSCTDTNIVIPEKYNRKEVISIEASAFKNCKLIEGVYLPDSIKSIGDSAFEGCTRLTNVFITDVAAWCNVSFAGYYSNPLCYGANLYLNREPVKDLIVPEGVKSISDFAFYNCKNLTSITIPKSVISISSSAFYGCSGLTSVTIPDSVTSIDGSAFAGCASLASIIIPNSVTSIGRSAFLGCTSLTSITIPDGVTSIGGYAFRGCDSLTSITIPFVGESKSGTENTHFGYIFGASSYESNGNYVPSSLKTVVITGSTSIDENAFKNCRILESITIPNSITSIGSDAFSDCTGLTEVYINDIAAWCNIAFEDYYSNPCYYAKGLYLDSELVTELAIPEGVTSINDYAFYNCDSITGITIPDSVETLGTSAFYGCTKLSRITFGNYIASIGNYTFSGCSGLTSITIPDSVDSIGTAALGNCSALENITLPFVGASKSGTENTHFAYIFGAASYGYNGNYVPSSLKTVVITGDTEIFDYAFDSCSGLTNVTIPDSVTSIGDSAFNDCSGLTNVTIGNGVTSIGDSAFYNCSKLTSITIPDSVTSIGDYAFRDCEGLTSVTIPDSVTSIGGFAFRDCEGLTSVTIPEGVTSIGYGAFYSCSSLTSITIPNSVTSIGSYAFYNCDSLTSIKYRGTKTELNAISKDSYWNYGAGSYTITYEYDGE